MEIPYHIEQLMQDTAARDNYRACEMARPSFMLKPPLFLNPSHHFPFFIPP